MWFKKKKESFREEDESPDGNSPEQIALSQEAQKKLNIIKLLLFTLWIPLLAAIILLMYSLLKSGVIKESKESLASLLSSSFILLGFAMNSRYNHYQMRDSKSLAKLRSTLHWAIHELTQIVVILLLIVSVFVGMINQMLEQASQPLMAFQVSTVFVVLIYSILSFFCTNKLGVYT